MTEREKDVMNYIISFKTVNGYAPTIREIAQGINTKSLDHIKVMLDDLKEQEYISFRDNASRTIRVLKFNIPQ